MSEIEQMVGARVADALGTLNGKIAALGVRRLPERGVFAGALTPVALLALLVLSVAPSPAQAVCDPPNPVSGQVVNCTEDTPLGFKSDPGVKSLTLTVVSGVTVEDSGATAAIEVGSDSTATNNGAIVVNEDSGIGMFGTDEGFDLSDQDTFLLNAAGATIDVNGASGTGMKSVERAQVNGPNDPRIILQNDGTINIHLGGTPANPSGGTPANPSVGIDATDFGEGSNVGTISLGSQGATINNAIGLKGNTGRTYLENFTGGLIEGYGNSLVGMQIGDSNNAGIGDVANYGTIRLEGLNAIGMEGGNFNSQQVNFRNGGASQSGLIGVIEITGEGGIGMNSGNNTDTRNLLGSSITVTGDNTTGIKVGDGAPNSKVINEGVINVSGFEAKGIEAGNEHAIIRLSKTGSITVTGDSAVGIASGFRNIVRSNGAISVTGDTPWGVSFLGDSTFVNNDGATLEVNGANAKAVLFLSGTNRLDNIVEQAQGPAPRIQASGFFSAAVVALNGTDTEINNFGGEIVALGDDARAIWLDTDPESILTGTSTITNLSNPIYRAVIRGGDVSATEPGWAIIGAQGADTVINSGDIIGNVSLRGGDDSFELDTSGTWVGSDVNGSVDGGAGTDALFFSGSGVASNPLSLTSFKDFESLEISEGGSWSLSGTGTFDTVDVLGTPTQNTLVELDGFMSLDGSYNQGSDTSLDVLITSSDPRGIKATGAITIGSDTTLFIEIAPDAQGAFQILNSEEGLTGQFGDVQLQFSGVPRLQRLEYFSNTLLFTVAQNFSLFAVGSNQVAVGDYLNAAGASGSDAFQTVLFQFASLSADDSSAALAQMSAEAYDAQTSTLVSWGRAATRVLEERPIRCESFRYPVRPEIRSKKPCGKTGWTPWFQGIGLKGKRSGDAGFLNFNNSGGGVLFGADRRFGDRWWVSGDVGTGRIGIDIDGIGTGSLQTLDVGASVGAHLGAGYLRAIASYSHGWHTTRRNVDFLGLRAIGEHGSDRFTAVLDGAYPYEWRNVSFEPLASVRYSSVLQDRVFESEAPLVNLTVEKRSDSLLSTSMGMRIYTSFFKYRYIYNFMEWADGLWTPELSVRWRRTWTGNDRFLVAHMPEAQAPVAAYRVDAKDAATGIEYGVRVRFQPLNTRMSFALEYDGYFGDGNVSHYFGFEGRIPF